MSVDRSAAPVAARNAHTLKPRQLIMMGLGSAIGAGLFLGSGVGVQLAGPAVLLSYLVAGALVGGILAGGAVLALGIFALLQCLGKRKMRMWLLIIQLVLAGVMLLTAIFGIISSIR